jgi:hypothetical protein
MISEQDSGAAPQSLVCHTVSCVEAARRSPSVVVPRGQLSVHLRLMTEQGEFEHHAPQDASEKIHRSLTSQ